MARYNTFDELLSKLPEDYSKYLETVKDFNCFNLDNSFINILTSNYIAKTLYTFYDLLESIHYVILKDVLGCRFYSGTSFHKDVSKYSITYKYGDEYILVDRKLVPAINNLRVLRNNFNRGFPSDLVGYNFSDIIEDANRLQIQLKSIVERISNLHNLNIETNLILLDFDKNRNLKISESIDSI